MFLLFILLFFYFLVLYDTMMTSQYYTRNLKLIYHTDFLKEPRPPPSHQHWKIGKI